MKDQTLSLVIAAAFGWAIINTPLNAASVNAKATVHGNSPAEQHSGEHQHKGKMREAWLEGRLETVFLFNTNLNNFAIDSEVRGHTATLRGTVESDIDRDLAEELAMNVEGIHNVKNELEVRSEARSEGKAKGKQRRSFVQTMTDASTTAAVKARLLANNNIKGSSIDVDTFRDIVTLNGTVTSSAEKQLAEQLALNVNAVVDVNNRLKIQ